MKPTKKVRHEIRDVDPTNKKDVTIAAHLHMELLNWGPIAQLGSLFLKRFVYSLLISEGLINATLFDVEGKAVGLIAYTAYSTIFYRKAIKKHWLYISYLLLVSIIKNPRLIFRIFKVIHLIKSRSSEKGLGSGHSAEILAFGVLPAYRDAQFIHDTGLRISHDLMAHAVSYFKNKGLDRMRGVVDSFNKPVMFFLQYLGGRPEPLNRAGDDMVQIWLNFDNLNI